MDFEVEGVAGLLFFAEPGAEGIAGDEVDLDVFGAGASANSLFFQIGGKEEVGELAGHPGRGRADDERLDFSCVVAGFFKEFAAGGFGDGFAFEFLFVADEAGGDFDHRALDRDAELFDEHDFIVRGDGEDADARVGVWTTDKIPVSDAVDAEPAGFKKSFGHGVLRIGGRWP